MKLANVRKALVAAAALLAQVLAVLLEVGGILPEPILPYVTAFLAVAGAFGVYQTRNVPLPQEVPDAAAVDSAPPA